MVKFKSKVTADLIFFNDVAIQILSAWGKPLAAGILVHGDMTWARDALILEARRLDKENKIAHGEKGEPAAIGRKSIPMSTRIVPLLKALDTCMKEEADLIWRV